ncbi:MAG: ABC transporter ATP-binding protein [Candidatus Nitrosocosmicus sp.]|nr:ABC transporter ATP-binding protein [Candidatus Nitrosocosmicus sp.]
MVQTRPERYLHKDDVHRHHREGPNGAGKTTTVKILTSLVKPSSGKVKIFGHDISKESFLVKKRIGLVLQQPSYESRLTVEQSLDFYGFYWGIPREERKNRIKKLLHQFDLESFKDIVNDDLSIGLRRRVQIAREFVHNKDLIFLDEPTIGLDPSARRNLLDHLREKVRLGLTIFLTTHSMEEAEYLCDIIAIINKGKIVALDTPKGLVQEYGFNKYVEITMKDAVSEVWLNEMKSKLEDFEQVNVIGTNTIRLLSINIESIMVKVIGYLSDQKLEIENIAMNSSNLEDVFLTLIDKK